MKNVTTGGLTAVLVVMLVIAIALPATSNTTDQDSVELTGCLSQSGDDWKLEDGDGKEIVLIPSPLLDGHSGHKVKLTGSWLEANDLKMFKVSEVEHLGDCS